MHTAALVRMFWCSCPGSCGEKITPYRPLYDMGLHGPDLMFYYRALQSNPVNRLGNAMHEQPGRVFLPGPGAW